MLSWTKILSGSVRVIKMTFVKECFPIFFKRKFFIKENFCLLNQISFATCFSRKLTGLNETFNSMTLESFKLLLFTDLLCNIYSLQSKIWNLPDQRTILLKFIHDKCIFELFCLLTLWVTSVVMATYFLSHCVCMVSDIRWDIRRRDAPFLWV